MSWTFQRAQMKTERCFDLFLSSFMGLSLSSTHSQTSLFFLCVCVYVQMVTLYLVKWCSLPYEDSTWELKADIDQSKIEEYEHIAARTPNTKRVVSSSLCVSIDALWVLSVFQPTPDTLRRTPVGVCVCVCWPAACSFLLQIYSSLNCSPQGHVLVVLHTHTRTRSYTRPALVARPNH